MIRQQLFFYGKIWAFLESRTCTRRNLRTVDVHVMSNIDCRLELPRLGFLARAGVQHLSKKENVNWKYCSIVSNVTAPDTAP